MMIASNIYQRGRDRRPDAPDALKNCVAVIDETGFVRFFARLRMGWLLHKS